MPRLPWYVDMLLHDQHDLATCIRSLTHTSKVQLPASPHVDGCARAKNQHMCIYQPCCHDDCRDLHQGTRFADNNTRLHARGRLCGICRTSRVTITSSPPTFQFPRRTRLSTGPLSWYVDMSSHDQHGMVPCIRSLIECCTGCSWCCFAHT